MLAFLQNILNKGLLSFFEGFLVVVFLILITLVFDWVLLKTINPFLKKFTKKTSFDWDDPFYKHNVFKSILHFCSLLFTLFLYNLLIGDENAELKNYIFRGIEILFSLLFVTFIFRLVNAILEISTNERDYESVAVRTFGELLKVITIMVCVMIIISTLFNLDITTIITSLSAITAVLLLVFRDTILGFVAGVQIASSKIIKVGDWISVPKYKADGNVIEINLVSAKVENFDKTVSNVPTYDLISSEVINYEKMKVIDRRRIKRSILFSMNSIKFCDNDLLKRLEEIHLIEDYIKGKKVIESNNINDNKSSLTNIGVFRKYVERYLLKLESVSNEETILVRQLKSSQYGLPLEVYCFAKTANWNNYESIQSDIFDHLIASSKYFDLKIVQTDFNNDKAER